MQQRVALQSIALVASGDEHATPHTGCLLSSAPCRNCLEAHKSVDSNLRRNQTCLLVTFTNNASLLVDCPMTFRDAVLRSTQRLIAASQNKDQQQQQQQQQQQPLFRFPPISGLIATSTSLASLGGIDDLREVTMRGQKVSVIAPATVLASITRMYPYILPPPSQKKKDANQQQLWTAHLQPQLPPASDGTVHLLADKHRAPKIRDTKKVEADVLAARAIMDAVETVPPTMAKFAGGKKGDDDEDGVEVVSAPAPGGVEMLTLGINSDVVGYAFSLTADGKIEVQDFAAGVDDSCGDCIPQPAVVYLPTGDILDASVCSEENRWLLADRVCRLRTVLAIVAWPKRGVADLARINDEIFCGTVERFVICGIPHDVPHDLALTAKVREVSPKCKATFEMGADASIIYQRK